MDKDTIKDRSGNIALAIAGVVIAVFVLVFLPMNIFGFIRAAPYFGTIAGASVGFCALIAGHLYNARLNRNRDLELRTARLGDCATAVLTETVLNVLTIRGLITGLRMELPATSRNVTGICRSISTRVYDENSIDFYAAIAATDGAVDLQNIIPMFSTIRFLSISLIASEPTFDTPLSPEMRLSLLSAAQSAERQANRAFGDMAKVVKLLRKTDVNFIGDFSKPIEA